MLFGQLGTIPDERAREAAMHRASERAGRTRNKSGWQPHSCLKAKDLTGLGIAVSVLFKY
jgi:hypothetical protein